MENHDLAITFDFDGITVNFSRKNDKLYMYNSEINLGSENIDYSKFVVTIRKRFKLIFIPFRGIIYKLFGSSNLFEQILYEMYINGNRVQNGDVYDIRNEKIRLNYSGNFISFTDIDILDTLHSSHKK